VYFIIKYNKIRAIISAFLILVLLTAGINFISQFIFNSGTIGNDSIRVFPSISDEPSEEWNVTWGIAGNEEAVYDLITDSSDNVYVVGNSNELFGFSKNVTLSKFSNSGELLWNVDWGGSSNDVGFAIAIDSPDNIYIAGNMLLKYDSSGVLQWNKTWGGTISNYASDLTMDSEGNIYVTGRTNDYGAGGIDMVLLKLDSSGVLQWNKTWGTSEDEWGEGITIDSSNGDIYVVGSNKSATSDDIFVVGYNSLGEEKWNQTWDGGFADRAAKISLDSRGGIYITGNAQKSGENDDLLLWKINTSGNVEWNRTWGGNLRDEGYDLITDSSDNVYIVGYSQSFGVEHSDVALLKYNYSGFLQWNITWGGSGSDVGFGITLGSFEQVYIAGYSTSFGSGIPDNLLLSFLPDTDTVAPEIIIHSPTQDDIYDVFSPKYNISIIETNLASSWYTIDGGISNFTVTELVGYIDRDAWSDAPEGPIYIRFYAKDYRNLTSYEEIVIIKKITKHLDIDIIDLIFSTKDFNLTFYIYNETNQGISFTSIQIWWNETDVSTDIQNFGNGLYFISLEPITVAPGEDPILLNITITALGYEEKNFETYIAVDPDTLQKSSEVPSEELPLLIIITVSVLSSGAIVGVAVLFWQRRRKKAV